MFEPVCVHFFSQFMRPRVTGAPLVAAYVAASWSLEIARSMLIARSRASAARLFAAAWPFFSLWPGSFWRRRVTRQPFERNCSITSVITALIFLFAVVLS